MRPSSSSVSVRSSSRAAFWSSVKPYSSRMSSAVLASTVIRKMASPLSFRSSVSVVMVVMSQNTSFSRSTRSGSRVTTSTPSSEKVARTANTASTSRQSGSWPWSWMSA